MIISITNLVSTFIIISLVFKPTIANEARATYIVFLNTMPRTQASISYSELVAWYVTYLPQGDESRIVHAYQHIIMGFAASLSPDEVKRMEKKKGFVHAIPETKTTGLHTTRTPSFLGLNQNSGVWPGASKFGKGVIVGVIDTGINPGHPSFNDIGVPSPPDKWKGKCNLGRTTCNNKIIGAKNLMVSSEHALDERGHGTHTTETVAGNFVANVNLFGQASGIASGVAPLAHVSIYKVCNKNGCYDSSMLAGFDSAIEDGVDILSISMKASPYDAPFHEHIIAIGAFAAMRNGIFVSCSAGNDGPQKGLVNNGAPWILTVGASTIDRNIAAVALLGNGASFEGQSADQMNVLSDSTLLPLIDATEGIAELSCSPESLRNVDVRGKVVLCIGSFDSVEQGKVVKDAGGAAMIVMNMEDMGYTILALAHVLPAVQVSYTAGVSIKEYINSNSSIPKATIVYKGTTLGDVTAPTIAAFSSRGPNFPSPGILKPDIIGPGLNIIAGWKNKNPTDTSEEPSFAIESGTSMACPHLSGVAALIKSTNPNWSPAMIKSSIMTSAVQLNLNGSQIVDEQNLRADLFSTGAGHVNPSRALDPGLVYDISTRDYISYLCFLYNDTQVATIVREQVNCQGSEYKPIPEAELNYPSFAIALGKTSQVYSRTVMYVGGGEESTFKVLIESPQGVRIVVEPKTLVFAKVNENKTYTVSFHRISEKSIKNGTYVEGSISWISASHIVRMPVSVRVIAGRGTLKKPLSSLVLSLVLLLVYAY